MKNEITSDLVISHLLGEGEWWYSLALFTDADLVTLLSMMGIENIDPANRTKVIYVLAHRLSESGEFIDMLRSYFNDHFLKPNDIPEHKSELWFNFGDCEAQVSNRLIERTYSDNVDPQIHKDFVLAALTLEQLNSVYTINGNEPECDDRVWLIYAINRMDFTEEYDTFLRQSGELSEAKSEHEALIEFLFGSLIVSEEEAE